VIGTANIMDAVRQQHSVQALVIVTTDKVYANHEPGRAFVETDALGGHDPYSASKACVELLVESYRKSFFSDRPCGIATARAGNVIGGGDFAPERLLPDIVRASRTAEPLILRHPQAIRPWQHVFESLSGYLQLAQNLFTDPRTYSGAWNFGPDNADMCTVQEFVNRFKTISSSPLPTRLEPSTLHETEILRLDSTRARTQLAWRSVWDLDQALLTSVQWYEAYARHQDMRSFSQQQLLRYWSQAGVNNAY
jgi:CDP-glucose 4,6-dehydratase